MQLTNIQTQQIESLPLQQALQRVAQLFPNQVRFSSSLGQEDQLLTHVIATHHLPISIFTLDTGRLFNETYNLIDITNAKYGNCISIYFPDALAVETWVGAKGINGFYDSVENRKQCCHIRKVQPLNRALSQAAVWITGLRAEQSENRQHMQMIEWVAEKQLYKFNPLIHWSYTDVLQYLTQNNVPSNSLHQQGFLSIGCAPCTRAVALGEDIRAGRWWWEASQKECGLHQAAPLIK